MDGADQEVEFLSNEHWMMLVTKSALYSATRAWPKRSSLSSGCTVRGFDEEVWVRHRERIVTEGTVHKFRQNAGLRARLFATGDTLLVEASPFDRIWGIGCSEANAISRAGNSWGLNLLGKALVEARRVLREEEQEGRKRKGNGNGR
ncbi:hypothetical protein B0H14DRAFT_3069204 [Mycena olivaceomarginata]|nr:hypothetical protein B0H14DRAFT_3069204 [Mycena olivaceomarginata]